MKKRLRKKLGIGEYRELCFEFSGKLKEMSDEESDQFIDRFVELVKSCEFCCHGAFGDGEISLCIETGVKDTDNEERRQKFLAGVNAISEISEVSATELA